MPCRFEIRATIEEVVITCGGELVGRHNRSWARHRTTTDPAHDEACRQMHRFAAQATPAGEDVEIRDLSVHDRVLGWRDGRVIEARQAGR